MARVVPVITKRNVSMFNDIQYNFIDLLVLVFQFKI